jgi:DNA-binding XRE family transcriptional regulator
MTISASSTDQNRASALRDERQRQKMSQRDLGHFADCSHVAINRMENGSLDGSPALKSRIARAFRVPVSELWSHDAEGDDAR